MTAKKKEPTKDERVNARVEQIMSGFTGIDGASQIMLESMVRTFAWYDISCDDLMTVIDQEGMLVDGSENANLAVLHKTAARKQEYFSKIMTAARRAQSDEANDLMEFVDA
jgi:hypothetical protein